MLDIRITHLIDACSVAVDQARIDMRITELPQSLLATGSRPMESARF